MRHSPVTGSIAALIVLSTCLGCWSTGPSKPLPQCTPPPAAMVDWWTFDESAGPTATDVAGNTLNTGNYGTGTNSPAPGPGKVAAAIAFDGNDFITVPDDPELDFATGPFFCSGFTIDAWIKTMPAFGGGGNFKGLIDELEFFHSANENSPNATGALTQSQIQAIYDAGSAGKCK